MMIFLKMSLISFCIIYEYQGCRIKQKFLCNKSVYKEYAFVKFCYDIKVLSHVKFY